MPELYIYEARGTVICLSENKAMKEVVTIIVGAGQLWTLPTGHISFYEEYYR